MTTYEMDSAYVRRCHKRLKEWEAPLTGWYCEYVYDVATVKMMLTLRKCSPVNCVIARRSALFTS